MEEGRRRARVARWFVLVVGEGGGLARVGREVVLTGSLAPLSASAPLGCSSVMEPQRLMVQE